MKKTRIFFALLLTAVLLMFCTACGKKSKTALQTDSTSQKINTNESTKTESAVKNKPAESAKPLPESVTVTVEDANGTKYEMEMGVAEAENDKENDKPAATPKPAETQNPAPTSAPSFESHNLKWEEFYALSSQEKDTYLQSFDNYEAFYEWMVAAQTQFTIDYPDIEIGPGGTIDLSKLK